MNPLATTQAKPRRKWQRRFGIGCITGIILVLVALCGPFVYSAFLPSAFDNLSRVTKIPVREIPATREQQSVVLRQALLRQLAPGTRRDDVYHYLEQHGMLYVQKTPAPDHVAMYYRFNPKEQVVYAIIREHKGKLTFPCNTIFIIEFLVGPDDTMTDITVSNESACL